VKEVNGRPVATVAEYEKALGEVKKGSTLRLLLKRGGSSRFVAIKVE
jgi:serine protease Do